MRWWIAHKDALRWMRKRHVTYVTGCGRSGTQWVASVLSRHPGCHAEHEPLWRFDYCNHLAEAEQRIEFAAVHRTALYYRWQTTKAKAFVESNPMLWRIPDRLHAAGEKVVLLVRDPRLVVRSILRRRHFRDGVEAERSHSARGTRLQVACTYWMEAVERVAAFSDATFRLEDLVSQWAEFVRLCDVVSVSPCRPVWDAWRGRKMNPSRSMTMPSEFDEEEVMNMVGSTARKYRYE
jgi:hypothetical protein